ncbi:hypothetical protein E2542_SST27152 [Spatholobus suberectus]|nr:hypothetical protein E2542_SST27152 [Spatholobus suberectus]
MPIPLCTEEGLSYFSQIELHSLGENLKGSEARLRRSRSMMTEVLRNWNRDGRVKGGGTVSRSGSEGEGLVYEDQVVSSTSDDGGGEDQEPPFQKLDDDAQTPI